MANWEAKKNSLKFWQTFFVIKQGMLQQRNLFYIAQVQNFAQKKMAGP
jgi:hypothetical protein